MEQPADAPGHSLEQSRRLRLCPFDEDLHPRSLSGTPWIGGQLHGNDAGGRAEVLRVSVGRKLGGALHEIGPHRESRAGPGELEFSVVVVTHPDDREKVRGEAGKPAVVTRSRLARRG